MYKKKTINLSNGIKFSDQDWKKTIIKYGTKNSYKIKIVQLIL